MVEASWLPRPRVWDFCNPRGLALSLHLDCDFAVVYAGRLAIWLWFADSARPREIWPCPVLHRLHVHPHVTCDKTGH